MEAPGEVDTDQALFCRFIVSAEFDGQHEEVVSLGFFFSPLPANLELFFLAPQSFLPLHSGLRASADVIFLLRSLFFLLRYGV